MGIFHRRGGTIGWLVNRDGVVVVDTQFADTAPNFLDGLKQRTPRQIDVVINTHHHFDHAGGLRTYVAEGATLDGRSVQLFGVYGGMMRGGIPHWHLPEEVLDADREREFAHLGVGTGGELCGERVRDGTHGRDDVVRSGGDERLCEPEALRFALALRVARDGILPPRDAKSRAR